jgi:hypothetical protein
MSLPAVHRTDHRLPVPPTQQTSVSTTPAVRPKRRRRIGVVAGRLRQRIAGPPDAGMTTAEYAIGTIAACAFAAVLYRVVTSDVVSGAIGQLLDRALHAV